MDADAALFMAALFAIAGFKAMFNAYYIVNTSAFSRRVITQRRRYGFLVSGQLVLAGTTIWLLVQFSADELIATVREYFAIPGFGWAVGTCAILMAVSPILGATVLTAVRRHPAVLARRCRDGLFLLTPNDPSDNPKYVRVEVQESADGVRRRLFIPANRV